MYGLIKTHKVGNPARMITSGCSTAMEKLSILVETVLFDLANDSPSRIRDTGHMHNIVDELNRLNLPRESSWIWYCEHVSKQSVLEALELCLTCDSSIFNNKNYLQTNGTAQGPHMSCSYADLALATFDNRALAYNCSPTIWKRFRDDVFVVW